MTIILQVKDGSSRYEYNVWTAVQHEDGSISPDIRIIATDDKDLFLKRLSALLAFDPEVVNEFEFDETNIGNQS